MLSREVPGLAFDAQFVAMGLALQLAIQHFSQFRRTGGRYCLWMAVWSASIMAALVANVWVFSSSRHELPVAFDLRAVAESAAFLLLVPTAAVFAGQRLPRRAFAAMVVLVGVRLALVPTTNLVLLQRVTAQGVSIAGPFNGVLWAPIIVIGVFCGARTVRRWDDPVERIAFGCGLAISISLGIAAIVGQGTSSELLGGYWLLPMIATLQIISSRRSALAEAAEERLQERQLEVTKELAETELRSRLTLLSGGMGWFESGSDFEWVTPSAELLDLVGLPPDASNRDVQAAIGDETVEQCRTLVSRAAASGIASMELQATRPNGAMVWLGLTALRVGEAESGSRVIGVAKDITELKRGEDLLRYRAYHDSLTGLPNRAALMTTMAEALSEQRSVSLLVIDVDRFKDINDTLGHPVGDEVLSALGVRLSERLGDRGFFARLGGDEFAAMVPASNGGHHVGSAIAQEFLRALDLPIELDGVRFSIRVSIGVVEAPQNGSDPDTLLRRADAAMYRAKVTGGAWRGYVDSDEEAGSRRLQLAADLPDALGCDDFQVYYQPTVVIRSDTVEVVEALARWHHPTLGAIAPSEFVPLAEQYGLGMGLTERVILDALRQCKRWRAIGTAERVAVNVSPRTLVLPRFPAMVDAALASFGLPSSALALEITEDALAEDSPELRQVLEGLRSRGIRIAIDDFGTGYSSLSYLGRLPIDTIKLDRSFTRNIDDDAAAQVIVRSTIDLAHRLGFKVVAEGVETASTLNALAQYGCDVAQGYWLSRPVPAEKAHLWMQYRESQPRWVGESVLSSRDN